MTARERYSDRVRTLEAFGHRGSATGSERLASDYLAGELEALGLDPVQEPFAGARSWGVRLLAPVVVAVIGLLVVRLAPLATVLTGIVALAWLWAEQTTRVVLARWPLVRFPSTNLWTRIAPSGTARRRVILCAHIDTQRTGWISWVGRVLTPVFWRLPIPLKAPLLSLELALLGQLLLGLIALGGRTPATLELPLLALYLIYVLLFANWSVGPYVPGATDNASGVAAVLTLAERWREEANPGDVELVVLLCGCEETGLLGSSAWLDRHRAEVRALPTCFLNLDGLGFGPPRFLAAEVPMLGLPLAYPRTLLSRARQTAAELALTDAGPYALPGPTDGMAFLARGIPGLTVIGCRPRGVLPHYHEREDTSANLDFDAAWAGVAFADALLRKLREAPEDEGAEQHPLNSTR